MAWFRRIPLFVRIAAMWWLVLFAYPPTRPLLFGSLMWRDPGPFPPYRVALSVVHVLVASWISVRLLTRFRAGHDQRSVVLWTIAVVWFAFTSGSFLNVAISVHEGRYHWASEVIWLTLVAEPFFALIAVYVTWIVWALAIVSVLIVRRANASGPSAATPQASGT